MPLRLPSSEPWSPGALDEARSERHRIVRAHGPELPDLASELTERALALPHLMVIEHRSPDRAYSAGSLTIYDGTSGIGAATEAISLGWISTPYSDGWRLMTVMRRPHGQLRPLPVLLPDTPESAVADFFSRMEIS